MGFLITQVSLSEIGKIPELTYHKPVLQCLNQAFINTAILQIIAGFQKAEAEQKHCLSTELLANK